MEILLEFVPDFTKLKTGIGTLVDNGTITKEMAALFTDAGKSIDQFAAKIGKLGEPIQKALAPAINQAKKSLSDLSKAGITDLGELKKRVDGITNSFTEGFGEGVEQALKEAGLTMEEFTELLKKAVDVDKSLKTELREITEQLAQLKLRGQENTVQYQELSNKAALYRDTLQDVTEEINRQASDTEKLDIAIRFVTGLTAAFSILQGVQGLLGKDNEELQKTLLKVNSAMVILNGLQSLQNELKRKDSILTIAQTAAQRVYTFVVGQTTGALKVFRIALASTGVGLLIIGLGLLISKISEFTGATDDAADSQDRFNKKLEEEKQLLQDVLFELDNDTKRKINNAKLQGASEEELNRITLEGLRQRRIAINEDLKTARQRLIISQAAINAVGGEGKATETLRNEYSKLKETVSELGKEFDNVNLEIESKIVDAQIEASKKSADAAKDAADNSKRLSEERARAEAETIQKGFEDFVAKQKLRLLTVEKDSKEELIIKKDILRSELQLALNNDKLTFNQRKLLIHQFFSETRELEETFNKERVKRTIEDSITQINTELNALKLSFEQRETLTVELLTQQRDLELSQVVNNETKRKEIISRFEKEINEQRKSIRKAAFEEELSDLERENFIRKEILKSIAAGDNSKTERELEKETAADRRKNFEEQKNALLELQKIEFDIITRRRLENQKNLKDQVISLEEYNRTAKDISNDEFTHKTGLEKQYTDLVKSEADKRRRKLEEDLQFIVDLANQLSQALGSFLEVIANNEDERIAAQKDNLQRLREGNAITEKEFLARMKNIEKVEKEAKQRQAAREKSLALFEALVNGAAAIIKALPDPFRVAVTVALVTAQIAAIASRPIPRFGKGTQKAPKGLAEVGETGTEIIETEKGYYVAEHPQIIWFKGGERVYNPKETHEIFTTTNNLTDIVTPQANMTVINNSSNNNSTTNGSIDYKKIGKAVGDEIAKHPKVIASFDEDGFNVHVQHKNDVRNYLNKRFTFND